MPLGKPQLLVGGSHHAVPLSRFWNQSLSLLLQAQARNSASFRLAQGPHLPCGSPYPDHTYTNNLFNKLSSDYQVSVCHLFPARSLISAFVSSQDTEEETEAERN